METILIKIAAGITAIGIIIAGFFGLVPKSQVEELENRLAQLEEGISFGAYYPVAGGTYRLSGAGIGTTATSVILVSFKEPVSERELAMTDFGSIGYATVDPGTSKKEFISFTGVTQDAASDKATLTGVSRGMQFTYPYTASSTLAQSHSGGAKLIISNPPQHYEQYANLSRTQTITGQWTFASSVIPRLDSYLAPTLGYQFAPKSYVDSVATSGAPNANWILQGLVELATTSELIVGTSLGGTGAYLVVPNSFFSTNTSAAYIVPVTNASGKLVQGFIDLTEGFTFTGGATSTGLTFLASTTINNTLIVTGTSTFTGIANFTVSPTAPTSTLSADNRIMTKYHSYNLFNATTTLTRVAGTSYQNTTGKTILCSISAYCIAANASDTSFIAYAGVASDTTPVAKAGLTAIGNIGTFNFNMVFVVPNGYYYKLIQVTSGQCAVSYWNEYTTN